MVLHWLRSSRISPEIEIFSIFARLVPTLVPKQNLRFRVFSSIICWSRWSINIYETFDRKKIAVSFFGILFLRLAQKQVHIGGPHLSSIIGFRSSNFAQRWTLVYWNRTNQHLEFWEKKYWEFEFWPLENESSPFCRTEWFHIHIKIALSGIEPWWQGLMQNFLPPWPISQTLRWTVWGSGRKVATLLWRWKENCEFLLFELLNFLKLDVLIQVLNKLT